MSIGGAGSAGLSGSAGRLGTPRMAAPGICIPGPVADESGDPEDPYQGATPPTRPEAAPHAQPCVGNDLTRGVSDSN